MKRLAKLLTIFLVALITLYFLLDSKGYLNNTKADTTKPVPTQQARRYILDAKVIEELVNDYREENGLPRLIHDPELCKLAEVRAEEIKTNYSHVGFEKRWGTFPYQHLGENIGKGFYEEPDLVSSWSKSKTHNDNIISWSYDKTCVAVNSNHVVQLFVRY